MTDFLQAARSMFADHGWISQPLKLDASGRPKVPIVKGWRRLRTLGDVDRLPWGEAKGIGIVLGQASDNLAALDIDDTELADATFALLMRSHVSTRMISTGRNRLHVYFKEEHSSGSIVLPVRWRGRDIPVELRAEGNQLTAPPTANYEAIGFAEQLDTIKVVPNIRAAWDSIAAKLGAEMPSPAAGRTNGAGYPTPWQANVPAGERNRSMYREAHQLRRAGIELDEARALLHSRYQSSYAQSESSWQEMADTIASAYRKADDREEVRVEWAFSEH